MPPPASPFDELMSTAPCSRPPSAQLLLRGGDTYRAQGVGAGGRAFMLSHAPSGTSLVLLGNVSGETLGPALQVVFAVMVELFVE